MKNDFTSNEVMRFLSLAKDFTTGKGAKIMKDAYARRVPMLRYKVNDSTIKFKGKRVPVEDLFMFVKRGDSYLPKFFVKEEEQDDMVIDMTPFICVGISELMHLVTSQECVGAFDDDTEEIFSKVFLTVEELNTVLDKLCISTEDLGSCGVAPIVYNMTSSYIDYRFTNIKKLASQLLILTISRPCVACEYILKCLTIIYDYASIFYYDEEALGTLAADDSKDISVRSTKDTLSDFMTEKLTRFKRIDYTAPDSDKKHYISDCRGLSVYSTLILLQCLYNKFSEMPSSASPVFDLGKSFIVEQNQKVFLSCIGDDAIGSYMKTGRVISKKFDYDRFGSYVISTGIYPIKGNQVYHVDGQDILRDAYEREILLRYANNVNRNNFKSKNYHRNITSVCYFESLETIWGSTYNFIPADLTKSYIDADQLRKYIGKIDSVTSLKKKLESVEANADSKLSRAITELEEKHSSVVKDYEKKIQDLEYQLSVKTDFITKLSAELEVANSKLDSMFTEEDLAVEALSSEDVSLEDMVDFLNGFKFTMVGGRDELLLKLNEIGWTNVSQISSESASGTMQSDFFCINTRFISHKVVRLVESNYANQKDQMFYYNGTNIQLLVQVCYDFVTAWFEKES